MLAVLNGILHQWNGANLVPLAEQDATWIGIDFFRYTADSISKIKIIILP